VVIPSGSEKDDAFLSSGIAGSAAVGGDDRFFLNGTTFLSASTLLQVITGASAPLTSTGSNAGLALFAQPGQGQLAEFSAIATNTIDPSQSFNWSAMFDGINLSVQAQGIGNPLDGFGTIAGGVFLPFDLMPGRDLIATVGPGTA
jgi:hypothetical protein